MELYFSPMACSLATRIALYEAGAEAKFTAVDLKAKRTADGADFFAVNPMGQVPVLRTETDGLITENPVVLLYVADHCAGSDLAPDYGPERYRLQLWLNFITSELHKLVFNPLAQPQEQRWRQSLRARPDRAAVRLPQRPSRRARLPARPF